MDQDGILAQIRALVGGQGDGPRHVVAEIVRRYLASVEFGKLKARDTEERRFRLHLVPHLGNDIAAALDFDRLAWYREQRKGEKCLNRREKPPAPATRNREVMQLSAALSWAVTYRLLAVNPIKGAPMENEDSQRRTMPEPADIERLLFACKPRLRAMVATKFGGGLRRQELLSMRLNQVEWNDGLIVLHARDTKTGRPRVTVFTARASRYVELYLDTRDVKSPLLFCTSTGRPISPRNFLRDFQDACARAGLVAAEGERLWLHDLRAGFIGHQLELGTPERVIMDMTGHSTHKAFDRYVRVKAKWIAEAKARADEFDSTRGPRPRKLKPDAAASNDVTDVIPLAPETEK